MGFEVRNIHSIGLDARGDLTAQLAEDIETAIVQVRPKIDWCWTGNETKNVANGGRGVAECAENCIGRHGALFGPTFLGANEFVEGGQVFDAQDGIGVNGDSPDRGGLDRRETDGGDKAA